MTSTPGNTQKCFHCLIPGQSGTSCSLAHRNVTSAEGANSNLSHVKELTGTLCLRLSFRAWQEWDVAPDWCDWRCP